MRSIFGLNFLEGPKTNSELGRKRRQIRGMQFSFPLADGAEITISFYFFSVPAQSPGMSSPCSLERCWLSVVTIFRPDNGQDLPHLINFVQLPPLVATRGCGNELSPVHQVDPSESMSILVTSATCRAGFAFCSWNRSFCKKYFGLSAGIGNLCGKRQHRSRQCPDS